MFTKATRSVWHPIVVTVLCLLALLRAPSITDTLPNTAALAVNAERPFSRLATRFEPNVGQFDEPVRFLARRSGLTLFLTDEGATFSLPAPQAARAPEERSTARKADDLAGASEPPTVIRMKVAGGRQVAPVASHELATTTSYFLGNDPAKWRTDVASYGRVTYPGVLDGVDLVFHGEDGQLEYDFVVAPGADPRAVALVVEGANGLSLTASGDLAIETPRGALVQARPRVYQHDADGTERNVEAAYRILDERSIGFVVASYDHARELVIDPVFTYATYLGGADVETVGDIAVDDSGSAYVTGTTASTNFPTQGALQGANAGGNDVFIARLDVAGSTLLHATYLGGSGYDHGYGIAVDGSGGVYVTGVTLSTNFPTANALLETKVGGTDAFVVKLTGGGSTLVLSTYLGGSAGDTGQDIAVDATGNIYVTGETNSTNFPMQAPLQASLGNAAAPDATDAFVTKLRPTGTLVYSTYLGGSYNDDARGIAVDAGGNAYVTGRTASSNFPQKAAVQGGMGGFGDAFVAKLNASGSALVYSTYLGGSWPDEGHGIAVDSAGNAYVTGITDSTNFPTQAPLQGANAGSTDAFVAKIGPAGSSLVYATYLGGSGNDEGFGIAVDTTGCAYVTGRSSSSNFPIRRAVRRASDGESSGPFAAKISAAGSGLIYSTFLGGTWTDGAAGIAVDGSGSAYAIGHTTSTFLPTQAPLQGTFAGVADAFIVKISTGTPALSPAVTTLSPRGSAAFTGSGGDGAPFTYALATNASGGTIDAETGAYVAGARGGVTDVVVVRDSGGNDATANVNVTAGVTISPAAAVTPSGGSISFAAAGGAGGPYTWSVPTGPSGGSITAAGLYTAGSTGDVTDTVRATDALGNVAHVNVAVGGGVALNPAAPTVAPRQTVTFVTSGPTGGPYGWLLVQNQSGATLVGSVYTAGATPNTIDRIRVTDPVGVTSTVTITVGPGVVLSPASPTTTPRGAVSFTASGGSGTGYTWSFVTNASGATLDPLTGAYEAGQTGNVVDVLRVKDSLGNTTQASVTVTAAVAIAPAGSTVPPRGTVAFTVSGGSGTGFVWSIPYGRSGSSIDPATGAYTAGPVGDVSDSIRVVDSLGNRHSTWVRTTAGVSIAPAAPATPPLGSLPLTASGGSGTGFAWSMTSNESGGSISPAGVFTAGPTGNATDTVEVTDSLGNTVSVQISVGSGLSVNPSAPSVAPRGSVTFGATGGSGAGYKWSLLTNASGGGINSMTGAYTAGPNGLVTDVVRVTDSLGNTRSVNVSVAAGVSITPAAMTVAPLGTASFGASGGSGTGFVWSLQVNATGGSIGAATGVYVAGPKGNVADIVRVADSLGNIRTATVSVSAVLAVGHATASVPPKGTVTLTATGGAPPVTFTLQTNASGGNVSSTGGVYTAGATGSVTDVIRATDANGATATATLTVGPGVTISPASPSVEPGGSLAFSASGGSGTGYVFALSTNASGGTIAGATGAYVAGTAPEATDVVTVTDSLGNTASVEVSVAKALAITPAAPQTPPRGAIAFTSAGGRGARTWSIEANASGGTIDPATGSYTAGPTGAVTDIVTVSDAKGATRSVSVAVGPGIAIAPASGTARPGATVHLTVTGGSGHGYIWTLSKNASAGAIDSATGVYTAGRTPRARDEVKVEDSLGNAATATIEILDLPPDTEPPPGPLPAEDGGCSCRAAGSGASADAAPLAWLIALAAAAGVTRRARSRRLPAP